MPSVSAEPFIGDATLVTPLTFLGPWNALTNTPVLVSSVGVENTFYIVSVAGTTTLNGESDWEVGDWVIFVGGVWVKIDNSAPLRAAVLEWGVNTLAQTTTTRYLTPFGQGAAQTFATQYRVPRAGTIRNMRVHTNLPGGNGFGILYTLRVNGVATALAVTLASDVSDGSELATSVVVAAGDLIDIEVTKAADVGATIGRIVCSMEFA